MTVGETMTVVLAGKRVDIRDIRELHYTKDVRGHVFVRIKTDRGIIRAVARSRRSAVQLMNMVQRICTYHKKVGRIV